MIKYKIRKYKSWPFGWTRYAVYAILEDSATNKGIDYVIKRSFWSIENAMEYIRKQKSIFETLARIENEKYKEAAEEKPGDIVLK